MRHIGFQLLLLLALALSCGAIEAAQERFESLAAQAQVARQADDIPRAISLYRRALELSPEWAEGWWYLATLYYDRDFFLEARDAFRRLAALEDKNGATWALMGLCEFQLRDYERALIDLQKARLLGLADNQRLVNVTRYHAAILLTRFQEYEKAFEALKEFAHEQNQSATVIEAFGLSLLRMPFLPSEVPPDKRELVLMAGKAGYEMASRRPEIAMELFGDLLERFGQEPNVHYAYGIFLSRDRPEEALKQFKRELEISPHHVPALLQVAFEYLKLAQPAEAFPYAEKAVALSPGLFAARNALGRIYFETGKIDLAIVEFEKGVELAPDSPEMRFALAKAYARAGRKEEAARERAEFLRLDKLYRTLQEGEQAVGGVSVTPKPSPKEPPN